MDSLGALLGQQLRALGRDVNPGVVEEAGARFFLLERGAGIDTVTPSPRARSAEFALNRSHDVDRNFFEPTSSNTTGTAHSADELCE